MKLRHRPAFSQHQLDRIIALNAHLAALENVCLQRVRRIVENYKMIAVSEPGEGFEQDFELESTVSYYRALTEQEETDDEVHDGLILQADFMLTPMLKWYFISPTAQQAAEIYKWLFFNWNAGLEGFEQLRNQRICWSFHELYDHCHLDWEQIFIIDKVWVDVKAIHQWASIVGPQCR